MERTSRVLTKITLVMITIQIIFATEIDGQRSGSEIPDLINSKIYSKPIF